uniref:Uncharacterized protein n=1 Tax=Arundo donax TaxID=35708 RepID=A0A0A9SE97_ARUDO
MPPPLNALSNTPSLEIFLRRHASSLNNGMSCFLLPSPRRSLTMKGSVMPSRTRSPILSSTITPSLNLPLLMNLELSAKVALWRNASPFFRLSSETPVRTAPTLSRGSTIWLLNSSEVQYS